jgi:fibronectin type 3 domain-containing protein
MSRKTRKLIWSAPLVAVLAVVGALAMFVALSPGGAEADHVDLPGSVTDLKAEAIGRAEIELSWKNPSGMVDSYRIDTSDDTYVWQSKEMSTTDFTMDADGVVSYTDMKELAAGSPRYYRVFAINAAGTGLAPLEDYVRADGVANTVPGTTQDLRATAASGTQIDLTWSTPEDTGHTKITHWCISVSRPGTVFADLPNTCTGANDTTIVVTAAADVTTANAALVTATPTATTITVEADGEGAQSYEHKGLTSRTQYRYRVTAVNSVGSAAVASNIASATTLAPASGDTTAADAVRNLRGVVDAGGTAVTLYWNLPADQDPGADGFTAPTYEVETVNAASRPSATADSWSDATGTPGTDNTLYDWSGSITAPTGSEKTHFRVRVAPNGTWSYFTFSSSAFGTSRVVPGAPATGDATNRAAPTASANGTRDTITLTWGFIPDTGATPEPQRPTGYELDFVVGDSTTTITDGDRQYYRSLLPEARSGYARSPVNHRELEPGTQYVYRIFPYKDGVYGVPVEVTGTTEPAVAPDTRLNLRVLAEGPTKLKLMWDEPSDNGGSKVTGYLIQVADDVDNNRTLTTVDATEPWVNIHDITDTQYAAIGVVTSDVSTIDPQDEWKIDDADTMEYIYQNLMPNDARWFRVIALNGTAMVTADAGSTDMPNGEAEDALGSAVPVRGQTARASVPVAPNGLVAEQARNSNLTGTSNRGVLLLWNAPDDPTGDDLDGYVIARKVDDGDWDEDWEKIEESAPRTYLTDNSDPLPAPGEMRYYRVAAFNGAGTGAWSNTVRYLPDTMTTPGQPTLSAMKDADMPASQINLTWTDPADEPANRITGYIIERAYEDVMFLNAADGVAHPDFAFSNHMQWWETLNCAGMLKAVGSSETLVATPAAGSDQAMYCAHYDMTAPSNTAGTIMADSDVDMTIETYFMKRYIVIDDPMTMSHMDTGRTPNTDYSYRIRAAHGMVAGMWSETAMAMTDDIAPNAPTATAMADGRTTINVSWEDGADNGGSAVTAYTLQTAYKMAGDAMSEWMDVELADAMATSYMHTDLMPASTHYYRVAATNGAGMSEYGESDATMTDANMMPMAGDDIADQEVTEGAMDGSVDLSMHFSDGDGDALSYEASSTNDDVADVSVEGSMLTIEYGEVGMATIMVTASDMYGGSDMQSFDVMVESGEPPMLMAPTDVEAISFPRDRAVTVTWTDGANADNHFVMLFDTTELDGIRMVEGSFQGGDGGRHTYDEVPSPGFYTAVVIAARTDSTGSIEYEYTTSNRIEVR